MEHHNKATELKGFQVLETLDDDNQRALRSWKSAAWAPVVVCLIDLVYEVAGHFFK